MAELGGFYYDLVDHYKDQESSMSDVIEILNQYNPVLDDAYGMPCNMGTKHRHSIRTGLPEVAWGKLYKGIKQSKATKTQVDDVTGFVEGMSAVDIRLLKLGNEASIRLSEAKAYLESIAQEVATKIFYGNIDGNPEEFMGLSPRYSQLSGADNSRQIVNAGGVGADNTSIWFVTWGDTATCTLYPQGTQAGVEREDNGKQRVLDGNGDPYFAKEETFTQHIGLAVKDWRYNARICNIDVSEMAAGNVDLYGFLRKAYYKLQSRRVAGGRQAIYCNRDVMEALDALAHNAGASDAFIRLRPMEIQGKEVLSYRGIPIRETDALVNTEAALT